jgi:acyl-CoA synthetase (AMP-forming)/AMP-acid ligase II
MCFRGRYHYPQEIERTVELACDTIRPNAAAAISLDLDNDERLLIAIEIERRFIKNLDMEHCADAIEAAVNEAHGLGVYGIIFLKPGGIPRTTSGKIKRRGCREGFLQDTLKILGTWPMDLNATFNA